MRLGSLGSEWAIGAPRASAPRLTSDPGRVDS